MASPHIHGRAHGVHPCRFKYRRYETCSRYITHLTYLSLLSVQILLGLPLEIVHGPFRIGAVYLAGVVSGSLARDSIQRYNEKRTDRTEQFGHDLMPCHVTLLPAARPSARSAAGQQAVFLLLLLLHPIVKFWQSSSNCCCLLTLGD